MRGPDIYAIGALLYYMWTGHAPEGEIKAGQGSCRGDLYILMGRCLRTEKKERCQSVREVLEALEKLEARIFAERHIPLLRIAAAGSRSGIGGYTYRTWRGPISAAERSFLPLQGAE